MDELRFVNAGYNVAEPNSLTFRWALNQHAFLYFQGPVLVNGIEYSSGACILYKGGTPHNYKTLRGFVNSYIGFYAPDDLFKTLNIKCDEIIFPSNCGEINDILFSICTENATKSFGCEIALKARILDLLVAIARGTNCLEKDSQSSDLKNKMSRLRSIYLSDVKNPPDFESLLKECGFSRTQGYKLYSSFFHSSPKEDLIWARLELSRNLMQLKPDSKIYEIAEMCGFSNIPHFFRIFKSRYGYTPKEYSHALKTDRDDKESSN